MSVYMIGLLGQLLQLRQVTRGPGSSNEGSLTLTLTLTLILTLTLK